MGLHPFEFHYKDGVLQLEDAVFQAMGAVSTCWEHPENAGAFDSAKASEIGSKLLDIIREAFEQNLTKLVNQSGQAQQHSPG